MSDPRILLHPNIPKPLHGINPRTVLGQAWWNVERHKAYASADYKCECCGVPKQDALIHQWLEAHEYYDYDYACGVLRLKKLVALCHCCHNFIHSGRLQMLLREGKIDEKTYDTIVTHGMKMLNDNNIEHEYEMRHNYRCNVMWSQWRMEINGVMYGPSSKSMADWQAGAWRNWKPPVVESNEPMLF